MSRTDRLFIWYLAKAFFRMKYGASYPEIESLLKQSLELTKEAANENT